MEKITAPDEEGLIEAACTRLQTRYGTLADRQDARFRELFAPDATITLPGRPIFAGIEAIMDAQAQWRASGILMRHVVTNSTIDARNADTATGICYVMVFYGGVHDEEIGEARPTVPVSLGEFHDRFEKNPRGRWLFKSRILRPIFRIEPEPSPGQAPP